MVYLPMSQCDTLVIKPKRVIDSILVLLFCLSVHFHSELETACTLEKVTSMWFIGLVIMLVSLGLLWCTPSCSFYVYLFELGSSSLYYLAICSHNTHTACRTLICLHSLSVMGPYVLIFYRIGCPLFSHTGPSITFDGC